MKVLGENDIELEVGIPIEVETRLKVSVYLFRSQEREPPSNQERLEKVKKAFAAEFDKGASNELDEVDMRKQVVTRI